MNRTTKSILWKKPPKELNTKVYVMTLKEEDVMRHFGHKQFLFSFSFIF